MVRAHVNMLSHYIVLTHFMVLAVNFCYGAACVLVLSVSPFSAVMLSACFMVLECVTVLSCVMVVTRVTHH